MTERFPCDRCGLPVPFEEWERGSETFCPSCGQPCRVPDDPEEASSEIPPQAPRAEAPLATDRTAGEVSVNPSLPSSHAITSAIRPRPPARRSLLRRPIAIVAMLVAAGLGAVFLVMESRRPPSSPAKTLLKPPGAQITPAAIAALGRSSDLGGSLVQADEWRQILHKLGTTPDDPRFAKLDDAVATLRLRLRPQPAPETAAVTAFRAQDRSLGEAIRKLPPHVRYDSPELVPARKAMTAADSLLETHAAELEIGRAHV